MQTSQNPSQEIPKLDLLDQFYEWIYKMSGLRAALELELWEKVACSGDTAEKIAAQHGWNPAGTRLILDARVELDLMEKQGDQYFLVPVSDYYLLPGKSTCQGDILLSEYHWEGDGQLTQAIHTGKRLLQYDATKPEKVDLWKAAYSKSWVYPKTILDSVGELLSFVSLRRSSTPKTSII